MAIASTSSIDALAGVDVSMKPDFSTFELLPALEQEFEHYKPIWHKAAVRKGPEVTVSSTDGHAHKIRLTIQGSSQSWRSKWTKWTLLKRKASELQGGDALDAQDEVSADGQTLVALIRAGETRTFNIEVVACLDSDTQPGTYGFDVIVESVNVNRGELRQPGFLTYTHPQSNLLNQLPSAYLEGVDTLRQEEDGHAPFFERFLLGFEDARRPLQKTIDNLNKLFGPYSTPSEFLLWLGAWVCVPMDENWSEMQRRSLISQAVELYRWQGTKKGLSRYIEIYAGVTPEINDQPVKGMRLGPATKMGDPKTMLGDVPPHTFVVTIAVPDPSALNEQVIHDIITFEKPAHTAYSLRIVKRTV